MYTWILVIMTLLSVADVDLLHPQKTKGENFVFFPV